jgi:hypothetical protein
MSLSSVVTSYTSTNNDLTLNYFNVRVDSTTNSIQISTTGTSIDVLYTIEKCDPGLHTVTINSDYLNGISTTPTTLYNSVVSAVNDFVEISLMDMTYLVQYIIKVSCVDPTPLYMISLAKY